MNEFSWYQMILAFISGSLTTFCIEKILNWWRSLLTKEEKEMLLKIKNKDPYLHVCTSGNPYEYRIEDKIIRRLVEKNKVYIVGNDDGIKYVYVK